MLITNNWNGNDSLMEKEYLENDVKQKPGSQRKMRLLDAFLLVFMRLRLGLLEQDLAQRFCVSVSTISRVLMTCACYKSEAFNCVAKQINIPDCFNKFPSKRVRYLHPYNNNIL
ncbi:hypothetical protein P5673_033744 [Acropora cervicornis]|uniref:Transposase Helix-turn-helix domain-containing protein n=1 Tax=Acropora cervicornis TaxID=6130 RepID=A0AAD9UQW8_ACRCE|nr:hypothetical protein P5673_033744 [Acropora cervicornis]